MVLKKKRLLILCARVALSLMALWVFSALADMNAIFQSLRDFELQWLPVVFGLIMVSVIISAIKWGVLLDSRNWRVKIVRFSRIYITALFFNNFLPSSIGGDGARILLAGRHCGSKARAAASVIVERTLATISLAFLGLVSACFTREPIGLAVGIFCALLLAGTGAVYLLLSGRVPAFMRNGKGRLSRSVISFSESAVELRRSRLALIFSLFLSLLFQIVVALVVGSVMAGLGLPVPGAPDLIYITSASSVLAMVPLGLNGYGMREGAYIYLLKPLGYSVSSALAVSILFAVFVSIFSLAGGLDWIVSRSTIKSYIKEGVMI